MSPETTLEEMIVIIMIGKGTATFSNEALSPGDPDDNNALCLTGTRLQKFILLTLVDNGSAVNVCPWITLKRLGFKENKLSTPSN